MKKPKPNPKTPKTIKTPKPRNAVVREMLANPKRNAGRHKSVDRSNRSDRADWSDRVNWLDETLGGTEE